MLTFILLVVLAGGVGLVAVSVAERPDPATPRRAIRGRPGPTTPSHHHGAVSRPDRPPPTEGRDARRHRPRRGPVPASLTAIEGSYAAVAGASPMRRAVSAALLVTIVVVVAIAIAGGIGLIAVAVGHTLDSAIG